MTLGADLTFYACLLFCWLIFLWEFYLSLRQFFTYKRTVKCPEEMLEIMNDEQFKKARRYKIDKALYSFAVAIWDQTLTTVVLLGNLLPIFWHFSGRLIGIFNLSNEILQSLVFVFGSSVVLTLLSLPWSMFDTFVIEEKHGFNKQTLSFFLRDQAKKFVVSLALLLIVVAGVIWIIQKGGDYFFVYVFLFASAVLFVILTIYPEFIAPLFDKYELLADGELKSKIERLADSVQYPLKKIFIVEGSKRSSHSNAYLFGFWKNKRIVLYDTLVESRPLTSLESDKKTDTGGQVINTANESTKDKNIEADNRILGMKDDEVVAVIGHELGHWKLSHNVINLVISEAYLFINFAVFALLYKLSVLYTAFGFTNEQPIIIGLLIVMTYVFAPFNELIGYLGICWSRKMEFAADKFSASVGYAQLLQSALIKLSKDNLIFPVDDWLYSAWHYSHPPIIERIRALKKFE